MNELIKPDFDTLVDEVPEAMRPTVAALMDLIESYERGDFAKGYNDVVDSALHRQLTGKAQLCLMRIYRYGNELVRAEINRGHRQGDSSQEGNS